MVNDAYELEQCFRTMVREWRLFNNAYNNFDDTLTIAISLLNQLLTL